MTAHGSQVLGIDSDPALVQRYADDLTHAAVADSTDETALRQLGVHDYRRAVVAIGSELEASSLTTALLVDFDAPHIWTKTNSRRHGHILRRMGAHHVVLPEHEMGERVAHMVTGRMLDYIEFDDDYPMVKTTAPTEAVGVPLADSRLRTRHGVTVVAVKRSGRDFSYASADTVVERGDILIVAGRTRQVEAFADLT
ncbi:TrkA family potassium uptake protein [Actinosynnema sp. NPDC049800]